jgi:Fe2+ or Zn2+ uptake regulation protein
MKPKTDPATGRSKTNHVFCEGCGKALNTHCDNASRQPEDGERNKEFKWFWWQNYCPNCRSHFES